MYQTSISLSGAKALPPNFPGTGCESSPASLIAMTNLQTLLQHFQRQKHPCECMSSSIRDSVQLLAIHLHLLARSVAC